MKRKSVIFLLLTILVFFGCQRRPLEVYYQTGVRIVVKCIWTDDSYPEGEKPTGVTYYFFKDGEYYSQTTTSNIDSLEVQLEVGHYQLYMISQSPEEYWKMQFQDMTDYRKASLNLRPRTVSWVAPRAASDVVVEDPEILCSGVAEEFDVTYEIQEEYQYYYNGWRNRKRALELLHTKAEEDMDPELAEWEEKMNYYTIRVPIYPKNIVSQFWVTIYAGNADVLRSVRASNSGMARNFELTRNVTGESEATQVMTQWNLTMDNTETRVGHLESIIRTLGLPNGDIPSAQRDPALNVSTLLIDNKTEEDYIFYIGNLIQSATPTKGYRGMLRLILGTPEEPAIIFPDVDPGNSGGFSAAIEDWGEEIHADIPI